MELDSNHSVLAEYPPPPEEIEGTGQAFDSCNILTVNIDRTMGSPMGYGNDIAEPTVASRSSAFGANISPYLTQTTSWGDAVSWCLQTLDDAELDNAKFDKYLNACQPSTGMEEDCHQNSPVSRSVNYNHRSPMGTQSSESSDSYFSSPPQIVDLDDQTSRKGKRSEIELRAASPEIMSFNHGSDLNIIFQKLSYLTEKVEKIEKGIEASEKRPET